MSKKEKTRIILKVSKYIKFLVLKPSIPTLLQYQWSLSFSMQKSKTECRNTLYWFRVEAFDLISLQSGSCSYYSESLNNNLEGCCTVNSSALSQGSHMGWKRNSINLFFFLFIIYFLMSLLKLLSMPRFTQLRSNTFE